MNTPAKDGGIVEINLVGDDADPHGIERPPESVIPDDDPILCDHDNLTAEECPVCDEYCAGGDGQGWDDTVTMVIAAMPLGELLDRAATKANRHLYDLRAERAAHDADSKEQRSALNEKLVNERADLSERIKLALEDRQAADRALRAYQRGQSK